MTLDEFRSGMNTYRDDVKRQGRELRDSLWAGNRLATLYGNFDAEDRGMADQVILEWILSDDANVRFDGEGLASRFKIKTAIPSLEALSERLASSTTPGASAQREVALRILDKLRLS
jgi:hypothetical protein